MISAEVDAGLEELHPRFLHRITSPSRNHFCLCHCLAVAVTVADAATVAVAVTVVVAVADAMVIILPVAFAG